MKTLLESFGTDNKPVNLYVGPLTSALAFIIVVGCCDVRINIFTLRQLGCKVG